MSKEVALGELVELFATNGADLEPVRAPEQRRRSRVLREKDQDQRMKEPTARSLSRVESSLYSL